MKKKLLYIFAAITTLVAILVISIDVYTTKLIPDHILSSMETKTWSHAGYTKDTNFKKNTINAFDNAIVVNHVKGLELDVIYDIKMKKFVVSHDFPYQKHNGELLLLDSVLKKYKNTIKYWLDFKNLMVLNKKETTESCENLIHLLKNKSVKQNNILIESENRENLSHYTDNSFYKSLWIVPYKSRYRSILRDYIYKFYYITGEFSSISMPYKYYPRVESHLNNIPINLWTINDPEIFEMYLKNKKVKIILSDQNWFSK
jgi:glycerophosphoryl diester phosphodiesterase